MNQTICGPADTLFFICIFFCFLFLCITLVYWATGNDNKDIIINAAFFIIFAVASAYFYNATDSEWNYKAAVNKEAERQIQEERKQFNIREQNFQKDVAARKAEILREEERPRELSRERREFLEREKDSADSLVVSSHQTEEE